LKQRHTIEKGLVFFTPKTDTQPQHSPMYHTVQGYGSVDRVVKIEGCRQNVKERP